MARPTNTEERRGQVVQALARVMARRGWEGASVGEVAREAGIAPGLVHYHFADKQEILLVLVDVLAEEAVRRVEARVGRAREGSKVDAALEALLSTGADADAVAVACWVAIAAEAVRQPAVAERYAKALGRLRDGFEAIVRESLPRTRKAPALAAALVAVVTGYLVLAAAAPGAVPKGTAAAMAKRMAAGLLAVEGGAS